MRKLLPLTAGVLLAVGGLAPAAASASPTTPATAAPTRAVAPYCGITWGSLPKTAPAYTSADVTDVRAGRHDCFDRLVVDLGPGPVTGYDVRYVPLVHTEGAGFPVPLAGAADLQIVVHAPAYDLAGRPTWDPPSSRQAVDVTGFTTFRQVADAGSFEGRTVIGLGARARLPFRTMVLSGPGSGSRLVIDVAHRW
jgi:hypothetical protein